MDEFWRWLWLQLQLENNIKTEFVFPGTGKTGHLDDVKSAKERITKRPGIENFRIHGLRRTIATYVSDSGANTMTVKNILGHINNDVNATYARTQL